MSRSRPCAKNKGGGSSSIDDESDSDDDFVTQFAGRSVFSKRPKVDTPNSTQSSVETDPPSLSPEAIEEQGRYVDVYVWAFFL